VQEVNGTIYYGTGSGRVSAARAGAVVGVVTVAVYLFLRFFLFGTVTRARLKKNENRSLIFQYILENPGVSLFDIAQALAMNSGTVRYHLMILGMNHRITSFKADEKFVRYFVNSGTYGQGDQLVISLMRREPLRRIIDLLRERPGLSNLEMSRALDAHESSTMRNVKLLIEKGIVAKSLMPDGKISYSLSSEYIVRAASALRVPDK
jgi:predicted transcriptional regulator